MRTIKNFIHGQLVIIDGAGRRTTVAIEKGNLRFTESKKSQVAMSRGTTHSHVSGPQEAIPISFSTHFSEYYSLDPAGNGADDISIRDALKGNYTGSQSVSNCGPFQVDLEYTITPECRTGVGEKDEVLTFKKVHCDTVDFTENEDFSELAFTAKALQYTPDGVRTAV